MSIRLSLPHSKNQWILLLLGLVAAVGSGIPLAQGFESLRWAQTDAVINYCRYKAGFRTIGVDVQYQYTAGGRKYTGGRFRFQSLLVQGHMRGRDVQNAVGRYQPGEPVKVSVNPRDPSDSVLEAGPDFDSTIPFVLGLVLLLLGLGQVEKKGRTAGVPKELMPAKPRYGLARFLGVIGVGLILFGAFYLYKGMSSEAWPAVDGRITYSHARGGKHYETLLWYEYFVAGQRYVASNYRTGGNVTPFRQASEEAAKRYPVGLGVKVYYNPANPEEAVLEPGIWWGLYSAPAIGMVVLGAAWVAKKFAEIMASRRR